MFEAGSVELIVAITGVITGVITGAFGLFFGFSTKRNNRERVVSDYLAAMSDPEFLSAREHVYHVRRELKENLTVDDKEAAKVINFYHVWGCMARHRYLPMWVFEERISGPGLIRLYDLMEPLIDEMTDRHKDKTYANGFKWLQWRLKKLYEYQEKHPKKLEKLLPSQKKDFWWTSAPWRRILPLLKPKKRAMRG